MKDIQLIVFNTALSFYNNYLNALTELFNAVFHKQSTSANSKFEDEKYESEAPLHTGKVVDEIRTNLLHLEKVEAEKYCKFLEKYFANFSNRLQQSIEPIKEHFSLYGFTYDEKSNSFNASELDENVREAVYRHHIKLTSYRNHLAGLINAWQNFIVAVHKELKANSEAESTINTASKRLSLKPKILVLHESGLLNAGQIKGASALAKARFFSELISDGKDVDNIRKAITQADSLRNEIEKSQIKGQLTLVDEILDRLRPKK